MNNQNRNRLVLVALLLLFAAPLLIALLLNLEGWRPQQTRNSGMLVDPPRDVTPSAVTLTDGGRLVWRDPQWHWTLLALPGSPCAAECRTRLDEALRMRLTLGRNAERLRIVYLGPALPADFIAARAPLLAGQDDAGAFADYRAHADDALALALVDPNGLLMLRYAEGYSAQGLRSDILRVFH
jgi:hypothetical protein